MNIDLDYYEVEDVPYVKGTLELSRLKEKIGGVYCLADKKGRVRYVGQSHCLRTRLIDHLVMAENEDQQPLYIWLSENILSVRLRILECNVTAVWDLDSMTNSDNRIEMEQFWIRHFMYEGCDLFNKCRFSKRIKAELLKK